MIDAYLGAAQIALDDNAGQMIRVRAGSRGVWRLTYTAGAVPIRAGGGIRLVRESHKFHLGVVKQTDDPGDEDYCAAGGDAPIASLEVPLFYKRLAEARIVVGAPGLRSGQSLWFTCGTPEFPATVLPFSQRRVVYWVEVDAAGDGSYRRLPTPLVLLVQPGPAVRSVCVAPSVIAPGESFALRLRFEDRNSNPRAPYCGRVSFECDDLAAVLPAPYVFGPSDDGWRVFEGCRLTTEGVRRVRVRAEGLPDAMSNPILCEAAPRQRIFWGDMHNHTAWCDGTDTVEHVYRFARDYAYLDVCGCSEHIGDEPPDWPIERVDMPANSSRDLWAEQAKQTREYHAPGRFVTFQGYEFTPMGHGAPANADHCVWFLDDRADLIIDRDIEELGRKLAGRDALMAAHVGGRYTRWEYEVPPEVMPVVEIASMHEHSEYFAQQALQRGLKVGIVGMSDGHMGCPGRDMWARHGRSGLRKRAFSPQSAITAFLAPTLDRVSIWQALRTRAVYTTTGARILLSFSCGDVQMGGATRTTRLPTFRLRVHGTAPIDRVQIVRGDRLAQTWEAALSGTLALDLEWTDPAPPDTETYYYVRVTQSDGHLAWSSPIWVVPVGRASSTLAAGLRPALPPWNEDVWPPMRPEPADYLPTIRAHLRQQRCAERFIELEQVGVFEEERGQYVLVRGRDSERGNQRVHIHYYLGFEDERLYVSAGWADYGQEANQ